MSIPKPIHFVAITRNQKGSDLQALVISSPEADVWSEGSLGWEPRN